MKIDRLVLSFCVGAASVACTLLDAGPSWGQKPAPASPQAPVINQAATGIQRGVPQDLLITGSNLANPTGVSLAVPPKIAFPPEDKKAAPDNAKFKVNIQVPADTPIGSYPLRVATTRGISNMRIVCVDDLPQAVSANTNRTKATAQVIPVPSAVSGSVAAEQGDYFKFSVKAGQRVSFDCLARRIGSAIDAQMSVYDAKSMREVAFDNDSPGSQTDPRISYTFKEAGDYLVEIKDVLNRGGPELFYYVRIGDFPLATTPVPMGAKRGSKAKISFAGPAVDGAVSADIVAPSDPALEVTWVAPKSASGLSGWPVPLALSDHDETAEMEPNNDPKQANRIAVPGGITGRFHPSDDFDHFVFTAKKGQRLLIDAHTLEYYSPSLVHMVLKNAKTGAEIAKSNPQAPPPGDQRLDFTAAEDGDFVLEVTHLHFASGPNESYRVTIRPPASGFDLVLPNESFEAVPGGAAYIPVQVIRKGYAGPIELSAQGLSGLTGTATIPAGKNAALLLVPAKSDLPLAAYQFNVTGKAMVDGKAVVEAARAKNVVVQTLNALTYPPMHLQTFVALAVKEKAPFSLAVKMDPPDGVPGGKATVTIIATREKGFDDEITLTPPTGLPATIPAPKTIPAIAKGKTESTFPLDLNVKTPMGEYFVMLAAKSKFQGKEVFAAPPPLVLVLGLPFDLKVEPALVSLKPGEKAKVKITAVRKGGYKGPIALEVRKLPATVTVTKAIIAADQLSAEVEITAAPTAPPAELAGIDVAGTATALNNLQNASPAFIVRVQKK